MSTKSRAVRGGGAMRKGILIPPLVPRETPRRPLAPLADILRELDQDRADR